MLKKIPQNLLSTNKNVYDLQKKNTDKSLRTSNKDSMSFSQIIGNSGWYNIQAKKSLLMQKSADPTFNNVIVAPYVFLFPDVELEENELKNLNFIVETKPNSNVQPITLKQWGATQYNLASDGVKVYAPSLVWRGGTPGTALLTSLPSMTVPYYGTACRIQYYNVFGDLISDSLRQIIWTTTEEYYTPSPEIYLVRDVKTYTMTKFDTLSDEEASGYGYYKQTITNYPAFGQTTYDSDFRDLDCNYVTDNVTFKLSSLASVNLADTTDVYETPSIQAYYDSDYYWPIMYQGDQLIYLPYEINTPDYPIVPSIPSALRLTDSENLEIVSANNFRESGVTASGQTFCYYKKSNGKYEVRIIGGIVYETIPKQSYIVANGNTAPTTQENYKLVDSQWTYDSTETLSELDLPYYYPLDQDVQIRCLLNYTPLNQHTSFEKK